MKIILGYVKGEHKIETKSVTIVGHQIFSGHAPRAEAVAQMEILPSGQIGWKDNHGGPLAYVEVKP